MDSEPIDTTDLKVNSVLLNTSEGSGWSRSPYVIRKPKSLSIRLERTEMKVHHVRISKVVFRKIGRAYNFIDSQFDVISLSLKSTTSNVNSIFV